MARDGIGTGGGTRGGAAGDVRAWRRWAWRAGAAALWLAGAAVARAETKNVAHPYILWSREEAEALKKRVETDETAKKQWALMQEREVTGAKGSTPLMINLFKYSVLGDAAAGAGEKQALLSFIGRRPPESVPGNPASGNAPYRDDRTADALRFDIFYNDLTEEQRQGVLNTVGNYLEWFRTKNGPWRRCTTNGTLRAGWLPNMQYPTVASIHVLAAATGDEKVIKEVFESMGGFKWWMDEYVADGGFYMEEFGKYGSPVWAFLLWCEAMERLGLPQYGYGYVAPPQPGKPGRSGGGSMRGFLGSLARAAFPSIERAGGTADIPVLNMGDAGRMQVVAGYDAKGQGGVAWWYSSNMWGAPKMMRPMWWEYGAKRFPEDGYPYFLAQMRKPGETVYLPSLYVGLGPVDPAKVAPPPAQSVVAKERGFALLRAEEGPAYWESPKPAVGLQFGMYYVHYVHDCFSILQYVAHNRWVYNKAGYIWGGYAGGDPVRDSVRGQGSGVTVDSLQIQWVDSGEVGCANQRIRQRLAPLAKFVAVRAAPYMADERDKATGEVRKVEKALYPGVDAERALVLTDDYLFDVFWLKSDRDRTYDWHAQGDGTIAGADSAPWAASGDLPAEKFWAPNMIAGKKAPELINVRKRDAGAQAWTESLEYGAGDARRGVRVSMLPQAGTALYTFAVPGANPTNNATLMVRRVAPATVFAVLHEPFKGGADAHKVARFERIAAHEQGVAVAVVGKEGSGLDDRILLRYGDAADQPLTLAGGDESFTFSDSAFIRTGKDRVDVEGDVKALKLRVTGNPKLAINGQPQAATVSGGFLTFGM